MTSTDPRSALPRARAPRGALIGLGLLALLAIAAACLWPATRGPFVFDDFPNLQNLEQLGGTVDRRSVGQYLYAFNGNPGRPLSALSFLIEDAAWPTDPAPFKRNNLLLHLLTGLLVFALLRQLARLLALRAPAADWTALAATAMWLLHPMQLSATMLVVQRMNILSSLCILTGLIAYLGILRSSRGSEFARVAAAGIALAGAAVLGLFCKENGVLVFAYATAINLSLLRPHLAGFRPGNRRLLLWGAAAPMILLALAALATLDSIREVYRIREFTMGERLLTQPRILFDYLGGILLPRIGGQGVFHDDYLFSRGLLSPPATALALLALAGLAGSAVWLRKRAPLYSFAVLWFLAGHLIESTVVALELYFEHRNYLPMIGPLFALAVALQRLAASGRPRPALALGALWLGIATLFTAFNATIWADRGSLAAVWYAERPDSVRAIQMLASYHFDEGEHARAREILRAGIERLPQRTELVFQDVLAGCMTTGLAPGEWRMLETDAAEAGIARSIPDVLQALVREAISGDACRGTLERDDLRRLFAILMGNPKVAGDSDTMGFLHYELAKLARDERDLDALMSHLDLAYAYRPGPLVPREQAIYLLTAGLPDAALEYLDRSDRTPQPLFKAWLLDIEARNRSLRASAHEMKGKLQAAH